MYCRYCGAIISDESIFCSICGNKVADNTGNAYNPKSYGYQSEGPAVWKVFSIIGFVLGIVSISLCLVPLFTIFIAVHGIVFSALGKKTFSTQHHKKATAGLVLSIISCIMSFITFLAFLIP